MHWSGIIRLIAMAIGIYVGIILSARGWHWYWASLAGASMLIVVPIGVGIIWGLWEKATQERHMKALAEKIQRGEPLD